jgi:hypothetical protein
MTAAKEMARFTVQRAVTLDRNGNEKPDGWDVMKDGEIWCQRYWYKREAVAAAAALNLA